MMLPIKARQGWPYAQICAISQVSQIPLGFGIRGVRNSKPHLALPSKQHELRSKSARSHRVAPVPAAGYEPFPFDPSTYHEVSMSLVQSKDGGATLNRNAPGFLLFIRKHGGAKQLHEPPEPEPDSKNPLANHKGLIVNVGGDTFSSMCMLHQGEQPVRPLSIDLLWQILEHGREISMREWTVHSVAITGMSDSTFLGRIFFGNRSEYENEDENREKDVVWDVDARPSDACWLALKCGAPIYIHQAVWESSAAPMLEQYEAMGLIGSNRVRAMRRAHMTDSEDETTLDGVLGQNRQRLDLQGLTTTLLKKDPETVVLLKMELKVALAEEDYETAARIRDSSVMKNYISFMTAKREGDVEAVKRYQKEMQREIEKWMR